MGHDHHHHGAEDMSTKRLTIAVVINVLLTVAQVIGGIISGSLALVADALHNLSDAASLGIALFARRISRRHSDERRTFGYARAEVIGALVNLTTLIIVGLYLVAEAVGRVFGEHEPGGWIIVIVAGIALVIDIATALLTLSVSKGNMNIKAAFIHNLSDAGASVGVIIAGTLIILYQWYWVDLAVTLVISGYVLWQGFIMLPGAIRILMESAPENFDFDGMVAAMRSVEGVADVHHVHVWQIGEHDTALEAHIVVKGRDPEVGEVIKRSLRACLAERFHIGHATLELEFGEQAAHCGGMDLVPRH
ncbi:cation diffusion facilitator family transporter [Indioceanicola profundi]|uniref:cation diffusion facilitator family transporter n=1 Tax=Indioceanicola profundi TaxID=2220096 RepID=UPI000E6AE085|nr:cation diffusion facilitator family transporter [Indioceanicola profundi]